jgi:predicted DNA-binding transcriptional regulator AlpA
MPTSTEVLAALDRGYMRTIEIAEFLGVSRQRADKLSVMKGFPRPRMVAGRRMWKRSTIEAWAEREWWDTRSWRARSV